MYVNRQEVNITTDSNGDGTGYTNAVSGRILSVQYVKTDFDDGVDFTITTDKTGRTVWAQDNVNVSAEVLPRVQVSDTGGTGLTYDDTNKVCEPVAVDSERIKIVIAAGGNAKTGTFFVTLG